MAVTLDSTVGGANANTYATRAGASAYLEASAYAAAWAALADTDAARGPFLIRAARALDALLEPNAPGVRATDTQALAWPREGVPTPRGHVYAASEIPRAVTDAQCLLAGWLAAQAAADPTADPFGQDETASLESLKAGPVTLAFRDGKGTAGQDAVRRMVRPILAAAGLVAPAGTVPLLR
ncbi:MAG TPA: DnaT-like ssDNA-binding protein [Gemmatimonadaceae bacterium]|nr:DnaT-like ssDNA-binding protein [Gemmatimonadaceae bacterium]